MTGFWTAESQKIQYKEGDIITHPSGAVYQVVNGDWKLIQRSNGEKVE